MLRVCIGNVGNEDDGQKKANGDDISLLELMIAREGENDEKVNKEFLLQTS